MFPLKNLSFQWARSLTYKALKENSFTERELGVATSELKPHVYLNSFKGDLCSWSPLLRSKGFLVSNDSLWNLQFSVMCLRILLDSGIFNCRCFEGWSVC